MLWQFLLVLIILGIFLLTRRDKRMVLLYKQLCCDVPQWPIIGHLHKFYGSSENIMKAIQDFGREASSKGGLIGLWRINVLYLMVTDAVTIEYILKHCLAKDDIVNLTWIVVGNASIFAPVPIWRPRRKLLTSIFNPKKLTGFVDIFSKHSLVLVDKLKSVAGKESVSMWNYSITYTMDAICETTMGVNVNAQQDPNNSFIITMNELFHLLVTRVTKPWLYTDFVLKILQPNVMKCKQLLYDYIGKILEGKRKSAEVQAMDSPNINTKSPQSFIDMMIKSSNEEEAYTNTALLEECLILLLAGTDTSAVGTAFTTVMLSRHPQVQEKVYQELQEVFGDSDRPIVAEDLPHLKYLEAVIKESLRLYPPSPFIVRKVDSDIQLPSGITLVKGCGLMINIWAAHRNPLYWGPDAEEFRPERFIEAPLKHPAAFVPFSYGPRGCIGSQYAYMSMKTTIANILRRYRLLPALDPVTGKYPQKDEPLKIKYMFMTRDANNYMVRLENRSSDKSN